MARAGLSRTLLSHTVSPGSRWDSRRCTPPAAALPTLEPCRTLWAPLLFSSWQVIWGSGTRTSPSTRIPSKKFRVASCLIYYQLQNTYSVPLISVSLCLERGDKILPLRAESSLWISKRD